MSPSDVPLKPSGLLFDPQQVERLWGGTALQRFGKALPPGKKIGESWEISDVPGKPSAVTKGDWRGKTFRDLLKAHGAELIGDTCGSANHPDGGPQFPLLIKLLDARDDLSVQVHPSDEDLLRSRIRSNGKTEAWVILDCEPGARIIHGLAAGVSKESLFDRVRALKGKALPSAEAEKLFRWVKVTRGDVVFVPAGTIHAVGKGILLLEVQQTSDITYRIYDWGRLEKNGQPRDLHLAEAARVSDAPLVSCPFRRINDLRARGGFEPLIGRSDSDKLQIEIASLGPGTPVGETLRASTRTGTGAGFHIVSPFEGSVELHTLAGEPVALREGQFALVPAMAGDYTLSARAGARVLRFARGV